eukprot:gene7641-biopygen9094
MAGVPKVYVEFNMLHNSDSLPEASAKPAQGFPGSVHGEHVVVTSWVQITVDQAIIASPECTKHHQVFPLARPGRLAGQVRRWKLKIQFFCTQLWVPSMGPIFSGRPYVCLFNAWTKPVSTGFCIQNAPQMLKMFQKAWGAPKGVLGPDGPRRQLTEFRGDPLHPAGDPALQRHGTAGEHVTSLLCFSICEILGG